MQVVPLIVAAVLAFLVSTQIELVHHLGQTGLIISTIVVWLILMAVDRLIFRRRFGIGARLVFMLLLFAAIWVTNSVSSLTACAQGHINCHRVFGV
jgi:hypothetical protein